MRHIIYAIIIGVFGEATGMAAPRSTVMSFSASGGEWQARAKVTKRRDLGAARMTTGVSFWDSPAYVVAFFETKQVYSVETLGRHETSAGFHNHQWEGLGLGMVWHGPFYQAWYAYGGGRIRVNRTAIGRDRYRYFFNEAGLGVALYRSEAAGISFFYAVHQEMPDAAWRNDYGYRQPLAQSVGVTMSLYSRM